MVLQWRILRYLGREFPERNFCKGIFDSSIQSSFRFLGFLFKGEFLKIENFVLKLQCLAFLSVFLGMVILFSFCIYAFLK